jgi:tetratricopeptide (TPR) repeat protein
MDDHPPPTEKDVAAPAGWSWGRADRLLMVIVFAIGLSSAAWQGRYELFGIGRAASLNGAGSAAQPSQPAQSASTALDYARLIDDENFHVLFGVAYGNSGMFEQAIFQEREALRVNPANFSALNNLGYYLYMKGNYPESASTLERALTLDPRSDLVRNNLHLTYARAIETAATDDERRRWQARRLALGAGNIPASPVAPGTPGKPLK